MVRAPNIIIYIYTYAVYVYIHIVSVCICIHINEYIGICVFMHPSIHMYIYEGGGTIPAGTRTRHDIIYLYSTEYVYIYAYMYMNIYAYVCSFID